MKNTVTKKQIEDWGRTFDGIQSDVMIKYIESGEFVPDRNDYIYFFPTKQEIADHFGIPLDKLEIME